ncbi:hypothetical protein J4G33_16715 [Actinotalea sp. BY-33]|uniref:Uncharacterized protein n=1 Tax=Actinotalea soli TaxID=2819234 RepID=A0A939LRX5_9CELL|nr:hypothetical protein [Actinotalea soli]MBO1753451.1 hypothetical protein [Actinotalea soli]
MRPVTTSPPTSTHAGGARGAAVVMAVALLTLTACGPGSDGPEEDAPAASEADPVGPEDPEESGSPDEGEEEALTDACGRTFAFPEDPVPGEVFAECAEAAMLLSNSYRMVQGVDGTHWDRRVQLEPEFTLDATHDESVRVVVRQDRGWVRYPDAGWLEVYPEAPPEAMMGTALVTAGIESSRPSFHREYWRTSPEFFPTGPREIDETATVGFSATPTDLGLGEVLSFDIWIDHTYRPVRIESTVSAMGVVSETFYEFSAWGDPVELPEIEE